ncbi:MAG: sigma factor-like helix-turn-helix DNA-binding protein [Candidatus Omnitrophota bacterium]|nr:sigma factor-like helix-turn-helix DNA-binding protein [Candidatus Omnitrophota bacterium]
MTLCPDCVERDRCKEICAAVKKEITGRGRTASRKPKTYPVDFSYIEDTHQAHNPFQIKVLNTVTRLTLNVREQLFAKLDMQEAISNCLNNKEKEVILFFMQNFKQRDIAQRINISQPRVNFLLQRAFRKLKIYLLGVELSK